MADGGGQNALSLLGRLHEVLLQRRAVSAETAERSEGRMMSVNEERQPLPKTTIFQVAAKPFVVNCQK